MTDNTKFMVNSAVGTYNHMLKVQLNVRQQWKDGATYPNPLALRNNNACHAYSIWETFGRELVTKIKFADG